MIKKILWIRFFFLLAVFFTLINSIVFTIAGVMESVQGYMIFYQHGVDSLEYKPGMHLLKSLDLFLVGMVFLIFGLGIMKIFTHYHKVEEGLPGWLDIASFKDLKVLLWETILVTLVVFTLTGIASSKEALNWGSIILPCIILILTLSLFLMKKSSKH